MGIIHVLDFSVANLIAAGEVVDRPASVVKELLENAIDAGSTKISVDIRAGGVRMIRVADNGCGISAEDLPNALKRHATSKIRRADDLSRIGTLGFRGEALAAVAAVSNVHIISKRREDEHGHVLTASCGNVISVEEVGCADGTVVLVEHLFENVPARRKFLKKDSTEAQAVSAAVQKVALSRPDISFSLAVDGVRKFITPGDGSLPHVLHAILGEVACRMLPVSGDTFGIRVKGYIGRSDATKNNRNEQNFFLNGRYVKSRTMMAALERAYVSFIAPERYPVCALYVEIDPALVDVNVHPAKLEVKFSDERHVFEAIYYSVRAALEENTARPDLEAPSFKTKETVEEKAARLKSMLFPSQGAGEQMTMASAPPMPPPPAPPSSAIPLSSSIPRETQRVHYEERVAAPIAPDPVAVSFEANTLSDKGRPEHLTTEATSIPKEEEPPSIPPYRYLGTLFHCYIILEVEDKFMLIDQHAAHERILFEDLKKKQQSGITLSQELMLPLSLRLTAEEYASAIEYKDDLEAVGMSFETSGDNKLHITAIPNAVSPYDAEALFTSMVDELAKGMGTPQNTESLRRERALYQIACKAAIKGRRDYDTAHIDWLCRQVLSFPDITVCPHGRPIAIIMSHADLDKQFNRI